MQDPESIKLVNKEIIKKKKTLLFVFSAVFIGFHLLLFFLFLPEELQKKI